MSDPRDVNFNDADERGKGGGNKGASNLRMFGSAAIAYVDHNIWLHQVSALWLQGYDIRTIASMTGHSMMVTLSLCPNTVRNWWSNPTPP